MILISKFIVPKGFTGITLFPFIFLKETDFKDDKILVNHEKIHLKQQLELLIIFFYIFYLFEWFIKLIKYKNIYIAYKNISFEREAYLNEKDFNYTKNRKFWAFLNYL
ncbi:hypothetical protein H9W90_00865 [Polaribacter pectinis]|uniref:DUF4157 domain-containing protein n=1 Tax=Polaribacter pectinis TaxID=2738844 RepID=A0A7G9LAQ8_9FLAO|nr:hypothetical protein [Polaribacter pectinis]QNM85707.1 hypothetical protein H9W90_00865 [Polaribacter pectinis]